MQGKNHQHNALEVQFVTSFVWFLPKVGRDIFKKERVMQLCSD